MKPWRLQTDRDGRSRGSRPRATPGVEALEGRALMAASAVKAAATAVTTVPQAYKPPTASQVKFPPYNITVELTSPSDGGGADQSFNGKVTVGGVAPPFAVVWLAVGLRPGYFLAHTRANNLGQYAFAAQVGKGSTVLQVFAENSLQDYSNINDLTVNVGNPVESWDAFAVHATEVQGLNAPQAAIDLAILHEAQYDAVEGIDDPASTYRVQLAPPKGASDVAAADSAAAGVLTMLFPTQASTIATAEASALAGLAATAATTSGIAYGKQVADAVAANRAAAGPLAPFEIASASAFRPAPPPAVGTASYDQALAQVSALGRIDSTTRDADQSAAALFWNEGAGSGLLTDPAHWDAIADQVATTRGDSLGADARLFAELDFALADAGLAASDAQSTYLEPRPVAAIQPGDPSFVPLLTTPIAPSYVSDDATYAEAAAQILTATFGPKFAFTDETEATTNAAVLSRAFSSFAAAASEDATSRVDGGVNFSFDAQAGLDLGGKVGQAVLAGFPKAK